MRATSSYILVSAARNEEQHIEKTLRSVVSQTITPIRWVIVSDGSTDDTERIIKEYGSHHDFIRLLRREPISGRNFGSKVHALRLGLEHVKELSYEYVGNVDADISFNDDYYERVLDACDSDPNLGIAGGVVYDRLGNQWVRQHSSRGWSVAGAVQLFRRKCFEDIGGYMPLSLGGVDAVAEVCARMHGWMVRSFTELPVWHYRRMGEHTGHILQARFCQGRMEYAHGYHPAFEMARCLWRITEYPFLLGSMSRLAGFWIDAFRRAPKDVPAAVVSYLRQEQLQRLAAVFGKRGALPWH